MRFCEPPSVVQLPASEMLNKEGVGSKDPTPFLLSLVVMGTTELDFYAVDY
jgi:hypothetical protein